MESCGLSRSPDPAGLQTAVDPPAICRDAAAVQLRSRLQSPPSVCKGHQLCRTDVIWLCPTARGHAIPCRSILGVQKQVFENVAPMQGFFPPPTSSILSQVGKNPFPSILNSYLGSRDILPLFPSLVHGLKDLEKDPKKSCLLVTTIASATPYSLSIKLSQNINFFQGSHICIFC